MCEVLRFNRGDEFVHILDRLSRWIYSTERNASVLR